MEKKIKVLAIIQARCNSSRFPNKVIKKIGNNEIIKIILKRLSKSKLIDKIVVATTKNKSDDQLSKLIKNLKFEVFRGSEKNVLSRYYLIASKFLPNFIVRITADCPFVDPVVVDKVVKKALNEKAGYCSNVIKYTYPDGLDVEVLSLAALKNAYYRAKSNFDKEHVTPYILRNKKISKFNVENTVDSSKYRLCIDEYCDFELVKKIFNHFRPNIFFSLDEIINFLKKNPDLKNINSHLKSNEGSKISLGQKKWRFAKTLIPGGSMLLSKNPDRYLPERWPVYFKKAKGCLIWDLENKKYYDFCNMGVGTNLLGYTNQNIDRKVQENIKKGNMTTLLCEEEVMLAEQLIDIHKWSGMVRFARTGGEANAIAIRIARNFVKSDKVAICGYHGWHDWYLSANLKKNSLDNHLLKGLNPEGISKKLKNTVYTFNYNDFKSLEKIVKEKKIKIIKMEVIRNHKPKNNFLKKVRSLADKNNIVLIFDECTSGFRENLGGIHLKFNVNPDIAVFGKALGNGYPITAVIGKKDIMEKSENTFISSTFWTDRIGPTAALATIAEMKKKQSWKIVSKKGKKVKKIWTRLSKKYHIPLSISGMDSLCKFEFKLKNNDFYKALLTQEMLKNNFLANNSVYISTAHSLKVIKKYERILDKIFSLIRDCEHKKIDVMNILKSKMPIKDFQRLN